MAVLPSLIVLLGCSLSIAHSETCCIRNLPIGKAGPIGTNNTGPDGPPGPDGPQGPRPTEPSTTDSSGPDGPRPTEPSTTDSSGPDGPRPTRSITSDTGPVNIGYMATGTPDCSTVEEPCFVRSNTCFMKSNQCLKTSDEEFSLDDESCSAPRPNSYSCYRTCIIDNNSKKCRDKFTNSKTDCRASVRFENRKLVRHLGFMRLVSPGFQCGVPYLNSVLCRYHVTCGDPDYVMYLHFVTRDLETKKTCGRLGDRCVDYVEMNEYLGCTYTCCGNKDLTCYTPPKGPRCQPHPLPNAVVLGGNERVMLKFQSNRLHRYPGFDYIAQCVRMKSFRDRSTGCKSPPGGHGRRSSAVESALPRIARSGRFQHITVPIGVDVSYIDYTVRVFDGDKWLHKFQNVRVFQVYNPVEGHQTYQRSAPLGRTFPGYGILQIGIGVIHYVQTGVPPEFIPTDEEDVIIQNLQHRIIRSIDQPPVDLSEPDDPDAITPIPDNMEYDFDLTELDHQAREYVDACNGFLRATACAYLKLFLETTPTTGCPD